MCSPCVFCMVGLSACCLFGISVLFLLTLPMFSCFPCDLSCSCLKVVSFPVVFCFGGVYVIGLKVPMGCSLFGCFKCVLCLLFVWVWRGFPHVVLLFVRLCYCGYPHVSFVLLDFVWRVSHGLCLVDWFTSALCCL